MGRSKSFYTSKTFWKISEYEYVSAILSGSSKLDETDQELLKQLKKKEMSNDSLVYSIRELTELLEKHYEKCPYPDNWIIRKHARVRAKESRGTRG